MIQFDLPKELIAQQPAHPRDSARLLVYRRSDVSIVDTTFRSLPDFLDPSTTMVVNNSKVEHCRWLFDDGRTEIFVLEKLDTTTVRALVRPGKRFKLHSEYQPFDWMRMKTTAIDDEGIRTISLSVPHDDPRLLAVQHVPLPPYIAQDDTLAKEYQTIYANPIGSKAAPTAGLHFTESLLNAVKASHAVEEVTLHVGLGTFASLQESNFATGTLHKEHYEIAPETALKLRDTAHITAVGTTTTRTLESAKIRCSILESTPRLSGDTDIFIQPGYEFTEVDSMITNFHLPGTSLLLMVEAFVGSEKELQRIYDHAISENYRFYSFGDGMLVL